jgi:Icc-related predicted phosphoesterase
MKHAGSKSLRRFIETIQPRLVVCGHIHESAGIDTIGGTRLVNPGPFRHGNYTRITIDDAAVDVEILSV